MHTFSYLQNLQKIATTKWWWLFYKVAKWTVRFDAKASVIRFHLSLRTRYSHARIYTFFMLVSIVSSLLERLPSLNVRSQMSDYRVCIKFLMLEWKVSEDWICGWPSRHVRLCWMRLVNLGMKMAKKKEN